MPAFGEAAFGESGFADTVDTSTILAAYLMLSLLITHRYLRLVNMPTIHEGTTQAFDLQVRDTDGPEDISGVTKVLAFFLDEEGNKITLDSTNPGGQSEVLSLSNGQNGQLAITPTSSTFSFGEYRVWCHVYTDATTFHRAPTVGYLRLSVEGDDEI